METNPEAPKIPGTDIPIPGWDLPGNDEGVNAIAAQLAQVLGYTADEVDDEIAINMATGEIIWGGDDDVCVLTVAQAEQIIDELIADR